MQFSAEISLYPLADEFRPVIKEFIERLANYPAISVHTNTMSTQVFGEYRTVMAILTDELERIYQRVPSQVLVCKFINRDLNPHG
ncbi:hypothetical protein FM042_09895 [Aliidiomarina halalkaliphila]|uniref:Thiamin/hydroxymethyl pyrimidine-binding YkoF putative domain-containing protein n=1 Tax=Aliidiomarina halalkaliphila TaxID=2593535 RepID=A0A552X084_9GAMM|nr:hypothetical protein [Aliidiomarina halalkaliphila]TRW48471.1 hypothetical protein FM042_09895 [Aliidiomarina halalkaliphila]